MIQRFISKGTLLIGPLAMLGFAGFQVHASTIHTGPGSGSGGVTFLSGSLGATAGSNSNSPTASYGPNSVTVTDAPTGTATSTTTANFQATGFSYTFDQTFTMPDSTGGSAQGWFNSVRTGDIFDHRPEPRGDWKYRRVCFG